jgi:steroid delta-isomerase-like uncharacterized protein
MSAGNKAIVRRYYEQLWNAWDPGALEELLAPDIVFRGSLASNVHGIDQFRDYVEMVRAAFPDFHNHIDGLIAEDDRVAARLTYSGTHRGELFGVSARGRRVQYAGSAFFRLADHKIQEGWVLGDLLSLLQQLGATDIA